VSAGPALVVNLDNPVNVLTGGQLSAQRFANRRPAASY
jgi:hypothetical protein